MSNPPDRTHYPTDQTRAEVEVHASVGTPQTVIADILGIDAKTLRKHYRAELDQSMAKANATIGGALFRKARDGDTTAQIFWMKTRGGWRETNRVEVTGAGGGPVQVIDPSKLSTDAMAELLAAMGDAAPETEPSGSDSD